MGKQSKRPHSFVRIAWAVAIVVISSVGILAWWDSEFKPVDATSNSLPETKSIHSNTTLLSNDALPSDTRATGHSDSSTVLSDDPVSAGMQSKGSAYPNAVRYRELSPSDGGSMLEDVGAQAWDEQRAEIEADEGDFWTDDFDPEHNPVTDDTVSIMPTGEFADQILFGYPEFREDDEDFNQLVGNSAPPSDENLLLLNEADEFADQIDQGAINAQVSLNGYLTDEGTSRVELKEVAPDSHPPTESGAFIQPD